MTTISSPRWTAGLRRTVLSNGLTLLAQRDASAPAVSVVTHVKAGFFDEPDHWVGVSHVLEHMFFKGTPTRGPGAVARETKGLGGYLNAHTAYDHTAYFVVLPPEGLEQALAIQSDALRNSLIDADELRRELQVIIEEAKRKLDSPSAVAAETLNEVMFDRHRIRRWRIGSIEQLERYTRDDIVGYYRSRYVPERVIVSIVGDIDAEAALALATPFYEDWAPAPGAVDPSPGEPTHRDVRARTLRGDVTQAELVLGWRGVPSLDPDNVALDVAAAVLASGRGSWLYQQLRETGTVTGVGAYHYSPTEIGIFSAGADLPADRVGQALEGMSQAIHRLAQQGPDETDIERARALLKYQWSRRMESMDGRAMALAGAEALGSTDLLDEDFQRLEGVTAGEVRDVAARYLDPGSVAAVVYLPEDAGADLDADELRDAFARPASRLAVTPRTEWTPPARQGRAARRTETHGVLHTALPGADILVRRKPGVPLVSLGIYYPRTRFDAPHEAGLGALAVRSAIRGAGPLDARQLAFAFEALGGTVAPVIASDWFGFGSGVLAEHAQRTAELLRLLLDAPRFDPDAVRRERDLLADEVRQSTDDMFRYPFELAFRAAFGDAGYGLPLHGTEETLATFEAADAERWLGAARQEARPVIVAVGDVEPEAMSHDLSRVFGDLPRQDEIRAGELAAMLRQPDHRMVERDRAQTALAMVFPGPRRRDTARYAANIWAAVASGLGGRLFEALRDRRSLAYTVLLSGWQRGRGGAMVSYIATSPAREDEARSAMLAELHQFAAEPVTEQELRDAIRYLDGQLRVRRQSASAVAGEILEAWIIGEGLEELDDPGERYRTVTADAVQAAAASALASGTHAEGVVRGRRS
ncbi:MAG TPA: pitrilysin family protein [Gemmatimonadales bacterium]|nr:pitrilysin family protein [Gemmatimonadales bacterium]